MSTPSLLYQAATRLLATPAGMPRRKYPLPQQAPKQFAGYAFDCEFTQRLDRFPPAPKNTPSSYVNGGGVTSFGLGDDNAILTALSSPSDNKANTGKFTATFHIVPATWDDYIDQSISFPGIRDAAFTGGVRDPYQAIVKTRQHREYFVADPDGVLAGLDIKDSGGASITVVRSKGSIPQLAATYWKFLFEGAIQDGSIVTGLVKAGGIAGYLETVPNTETYQAWAAVAAAFNLALATDPPGPDWDEDHPPIWDGVDKNTVTVGQYRFANSRIEDYAGNIFCRVSEYVLVHSPS